VKAGSKIVEKIQKNGKNLRFKLGHDLKFIIESLDKDKEYKRLEVSEESDISDSAID